MGESINAAQVSAVAVAVVVLTVDRTRTASSGPPEGSAQAEKRSHGRSGVFGTCSSQFFRFVVCKYFFTGLICFFATVAKNQRHGKTKQMALRLTHHPADISSEQRVTAIRTALRIVDEIWDFTENEAAELLDTTADGIRTWRETPDSEPITDDQLLRVSYILGIHRALDTLVPKRSAHAGFMRRENPALDGASPLDVMREGTVGLGRIRHWLDGECQW